MGELKYAGTLVCCGREMNRLEANTTDAATEKHVPEVELNGDVLTVRVGSVQHPMMSEHFIEWVYVQTERGGQRRAFEPGDRAEATFNVGQDNPLEVFAYCNLHGLWAMKI